MSTIRIQALPKFPASVEAGDGITIERSGGVFTFSLDTESGVFVPFNGSLGTPSSGTLTNATGLPVSTGISGLGTSVATALTVNVGTDGAFVVKGGALGTPSSGIGTNITNVDAATLGGATFAAPSAIGIGTPSTGAFTSLLASTSLTSPIHYGGSAASSTLTLASTSGAGTTDAIRFQTGSQVHAGGINTSGQWSLGPNVAPNTGVKLTVNKNTVTPAAHTGGGIIIAQFTGANNTQPVVALDSFGNSGIAESFLSFRTARGTQGSYTATQNNDFLGFISMVGASGANTFVDCSGSAGGVYWGGQATENWSATNQGAKLSIYTTTNGAAVISQAAQFAGGFSVGTTSDPGAGMIYTNAATFMIRTKTSYANGAAAGAGTLTNAPAAGNPTKWIPIDDNGTTRYLPAW